MVPRRLYQPPGTVRGMARPLLGARVISRDEDVFTIAVAAYVLFSLLDCFTTAVALAGGHAFERNPFAAAVYHAHGIAGLYVLKLAVVVAVIVGLRVLPRSLAAWVATAFTAIAALAVVANLHVLAG